MLSKFPEKISSENVTLALTLDEVYVELIEDLSPEEIKRFVNKYQLEVIEEPRFFGSSQFEALYSDWLWLRIREGELTDEFMEKLYTDELVKVVNPVYHRPDILSKTGLTFSDLLLVGIQPQVSIEKFTTLIQEFKDVEDVTREPNLLGEDVRLLRIKVPQKHHALEVADELEKLPIVEYAGPDWIPLHSTLSIPPNDTYYKGPPNLNLTEWNPTEGYQWNLHKIGFPDAWAVYGNKIIPEKDKAVIAILDTGCDLDHEDLKGKYVKNKHWLNVLNDLGVDTIDDLHFPQDYQWHGTLCAGIAAAETDNGKGIAGVGWPCKIMPIKLSGWYKKYDANGNIYLNKSNKTELGIIKAIKWAVNHGANVISMSWTWLGPPSKSLIKAFQHAIKKDVVLVTVAGHYLCQNECMTQQIRTLDKDLVSLKGYFQTQDEVIVVGASDTDDKRHRYDLNKNLVLDTSPDKEKWSSSYGEGLDVMAPGVYLWTTDIRDTKELSDLFKKRYDADNEYPFVVGAGGNCTKGTLFLNPNSCKLYYKCGDEKGNYLSLMFGTSGAVPHVAGLAGLLRSLFPKLTAKEVIEIICKTADKVGGYSYNIPNTYGSWNEEMGYGRINMKKALVEAENVYKKKPKP